MAEQRDPWPDLVDRALFERDPAQQSKCLKDARRALVDRMLELLVEMQMIKEAQQKLDNLSPPAPKFTPIADPKRKADPRGASKVAAKRNPKAKSKRRTNGTLPK